MAGDIGIQERAIVLGPEAKFTSVEAAESLEQTQGRPMHFYGPRVIIAEVSPEAVEAAEALEALDVGEKSSDIAAEARSDLDLTGELGLKALDLRQTKKYKTAKDSRPYAEEEWDNDETQAPDFHDDGAPEFGALEAEAGAPTSARLVGSVAVGVIIVEGPTNNLKFSNAERAKVVAEVQNGLGWLGSYSTPAGVTWHHDIKIVTLNVPPGPAGASSGQKEALWRNPAMAALGYAPNWSGVQKYVEDLRTAKGTNWAYCAFFTKYPVGHFAYAALGGPRLVMHYDNDGWGPDNIDRVFAHETGHIFNAPDEYASSGCNCGGKWGYYQVPNKNCANCAPGGGIPCIMKSNSWEMCEYTPYHLGFPQKQRYSGVWIKGSGGYGLWVNASWPHFRNKWKQWSNNGLRLIDLEIHKVGGQLRYSGVFRQGSGGYALWVNASWPSFRSKWQQWSKQGLRLIDIEIRRVGNQWRYSGVFIKGAGGHALWVNASWSSFFKKWQQWSKQGLRLIDLEITRVGNQWRYTGVFRQGGGGYALLVHSNWTNFINNWKTLSGKGLRLIDIEFTTVAGQRRYSGVFRQGSGGYGLWVNANWASFLDKWKKWAGLGLRLVDLEITVPGSVPGSGAGFAPAGSAIFPETEALETMAGSDSDTEDDEAGFGEGVFDDEGPSGLGPNLLESFTEDEEGVGFEQSFFEEEAAAEAGGGFGESSLDDVEEADFGQSAFEGVASGDEDDGIGGILLDDTSDIPTGSEEGEGGFGDVVLSS